MKSINLHVWSILEQDLSILKDLQRGLINTRALAKYLINHHKLSASLDSVVSAIRRFDVEGIKVLHEKTESVFKDAIIITRSNIATLALKERSFDCIAQDYLQGNTLKKNFRVVKSKEFMRLIVSQKDIEKKLTMFTHNGVLGVNKDLGEIRIVFNKDISKMRGVIARVTNELLMIDVGVVDLLMCPPELLLYVPEKNLVSAHQKILELCGKK
jgi:hypothetical protein